MISPNSTLYPHLGFTVHTGSVYDATFIDALYWPNYNITNMVETNCTNLDSLPYPDPLPTGIMCDEEEGYAFFRPLDPVALDNFGEIHYFHDDNADLDVDSPGETGTLLQCALETIPLYTCVLNVAYYDGEVMGVGDSTFFLTLDQLPGNDCFSSVETPGNVVCRYNTLSYNFEPPDQNFTIPIITNNNRQLRIPCEMTPPTQYSCSVNDTGPARAFNGTAVNDLYYLVGGEADNYAPVPCLQNAITETALCTQINITYDDATEVTLQFEGTTARFYINDTRQDLICSTLNTNNVNETGVLGQVQEYYGLHTQQETTTAFETMVTNTIQRVQTKLRIPHEMISTIQHQVNSMLANHTGQFRKNSLICCVSETIRYLGRFIIAFVFEVSLFFLDTYNYSNFLLFQ